MILYLFCLGHVMVSKLMNRPVGGVCLVALLQSQLFYNTAQYSECRIVALSLIYAQNCSL